jgi:hypothetical protein
MDKEEMKIIEDAVKSKGLNEVEEMFVNDIGTYSRDLIAFLLSVKAASPKVSKYTTEFALSSIIMLVSDNRDEMFSIIEGIRGHITKLDKLIIKH